VSAIALALALALVAVAAVVVSAVAVARPRRSTAFVRVVVVATSAPRRRTASRATLPRSVAAVALTVALVSSGASFDAGRGSRSATEFLHELLHLSVDSIAAAGTAAGTGPGAAVTPASALLAIGTILGHVPSITTNSANNAGRVVLSVGTVNLAMTNLTTVLAGLVLVVSQGTVESSELTKLVALEFVLAFGDGSRSLNDVVNQLLGLVHLFFGVGHDQAVEILLLVAGVGSIRSTFALLDGALATNGNLGARICLHLL
jgi:hypothetical protein